MIRRFNRFELKYVIASELRDRLWDEMRLHMSPDREGGDAGIYRVTSLYHDTSIFACYRAKLDSINFRRKLRIRR